jgi:hypothetical protein
MKRLIFAGLLVLITRAAQAQAYTTLGPIGGFTPLRRFAHLEL